MFTYPYHFGICLFIKLFPYIKFHVIALTGLKGEAVNIPKHNSPITFSRPFPWDIDLEGVCQFSVLLLAPSPRRPLDVAPLSRRLMYGLRDSVQGPQPQLPWMEMMIKHV